MYSFDSENQTYSNKARWEVEDRDNHWYVSEYIEGKSSHDVYGPMWQEMVMPLIDERREHIQAIHANSLKHLLSDRFDAVG